MAAKNDWITLYYEDRQNMAEIMRNNLASDIKYGCSSTRAFRELERIEAYERETEVKMDFFLRAWNGQNLAYHDMKRRGAIL